MSNISNSGKSIAVNAGMWMFGICTIIGLAMEFRPIVIVERAIMASALSGMLVYLLMSVIRKYTANIEPVGTQEDDDRESVGTVQ